ncbi:hypothetical protein ABPG77_005833 [Micractinium sp. CCAP 211/92]
MHHARVFPGVGWADDGEAGEPPSTTGPPAPGQTSQAFNDSDAPLDGVEDAVKVVVRVRPPLPREMDGFRPFQNAVLVGPGQPAQVVTLSENLAALSNNGVENGLVYNTYRFGFDRVYGPECSQEDVYVESARNAVQNVLQGYNASIVAYGQTGTGKTYTMEGERTGEERGIIPRAIEDVFGYIQRDTGERCKFLVRASYLQIYNEVISDLLKPESANLVVREDRRRGVHVEGLSEWVVRSPAEVYALMERGAAVRATGATKLNEISSRSHAIFMLIVEKSTPAGEEEGGGRGGGEPYGSGRSRPPSTRQSIKVGKLNLVDLAGSERVHVTGATGKRLEESKKINQSLSALGNVIAALTDPRGRESRPHVPYRDSKLTRILEDSLGGNCKTTFMAMVSPAVEAFAESLSTLKFANRAKCMRNLPKVNEDLDQRTLLRKYERELRRLRAELQQKSKDLVDKRLVLQIEEARRREQADKIAAIHALERQSQEIMRHKQAMQALQTHIASMQSQLLIGGQKIEDTPQFRTLLAKEQARIRQQYEERLRELENERQSVQEDKAQVERYKGLLLKQRDIMIALTQRLNERDEQILALQAELEAYDSRQKKLEDALDQKTAELIALRRAAMEHPSKAAVHDATLDRAAEGVRSRTGSAGGADWEIPASMGSNASAAAQGELGAGAAAAGLFVGPQPVVLTPDSEYGGSEASSPLARAGQHGGSDFGGAMGAGLGSGGAGPVDGLALQVEELRLHHGRELAEREAHWRSQCDALQSRLDAAQAAAAQQQQQRRQQQAAGAGGASSAALAAQCDALCKEREALRTILDNKVRVLVDDIGRSMAELPLEAQAHPKLGKQLEYLGKLVRATVQAMATQQPSGAVH